jgi:hypothetical protein
MEIPPLTSSFVDGVAVPIQTLPPVSTILEFPIVFAPLNFGIYPEVPDIFELLISFFATIGHCVTVSYAV